MSRSVIETVLGAVVLAVAAVFLVFAYQTADLRAGNGYMLTARFNDVGGLERGTEVTLGGVVVGSVVDLGIDPATYRAEVTMNIDSAIQVPDDSIAVIGSQSLLGGKVLSLQAGASEDMLQPGDMFEYTQSNPGIEQMLGQVIFSLQNLGGEDSAQ